MIRRNTNTEITEPDLVASICRESFVDFVKEFWSSIVPEDLTWNWHMDLMCNELQYMAELVFAGEPKEHDLIINISPGSTKSTIASVMFPAWTWTRMPSARHICASHTYTPLGINLSRLTRDVVQSEKYQECFPDIELRDDQNTKGFYQNTSGGYRLTVTVGGKSPVGMHGHFLNVDDPLDPMNARSITGADIKAANDWMNEVLPTRKVDKTIVPTMLIMQRLHQNDPTGNRLEREGGGKVKHICLPANCNEYAVEPPELAQFYENGLMDPIRLSAEVLKEARSELGEFGYSGQYGQDPVPLGGGAFKVDLTTIDVPPLLFKQLVRYWDKAGTTGGGAFTVGTLMGLDFDGRFWVLDVVRFQEDAYKREKIIRQTAEEDGRKVRIGVEQEPGSGGKESAQNTLRNLAGYRVILHAVGQSDGNKELRAEPFMDQMNGGNVYLASKWQGVKCKWIKVWKDEFRFFPSSRYKDQVDSGSGSFNILANRRRKVGAL